MRTVNARLTKLYAMVDVAEKMISGEIDPVAGSRKVSNLRTNVEGDDWEYDSDSPFRDRVA
jgi:hypothetical protein